MKKNVGDIDRIIRILVGLALLAWYFFAQGPVWALVGILPLATGLFTVCPAYSVLGINTCKTK